jgi:hypothetical protein
MLTLIDATVRWFPFIVKHTMFALYFLQVFFGLLVLFSKLQHVDIYICASTSKSQMHYIKHFKLHQWCQFSVQNNVKKYDDSMDIKTKTNVCRAIVTAKSTTVARQQHGNLNSFLMLEWFCPTHEFVCVQVFVFVDMCVCLHLQFLEMF